MKALEMNAVISLKIAEKYNLPGILRLVYEALRSYKNNKSHKAHPSINTIAKKIGMSRNTVKSYIRKLEARGLLLVTERQIILDDGRSWNDTHEYTFTAEKYNEAKTYKRTRRVEKESDYNKYVREFKEAKRTLIESYNIGLVEEAIGAALKNIRMGYSIKHPLKYIKTIVKNLESKKEMSKLAYDPEVIKLAGDNVKSKKNKSYQKKKNSFHNFEQRTSNYSAKELNEIVEKSQREKFANK